MPRQDRDGNKSARVGGRGVPSKRNKHVPLTDAEKAVKVKELKQQLLKDVHELSRDIVKFEKAFLEGVDTSGIGESNAKPAQSEEAQDVIPTTALHLKYKREGVTKGSFKSSVAERAQNKHLVGYVKKAATGSTSGAVWAMPELGEDQKTAFDTMNKWLKKNQCKVQVLEPCGPDIVPEAYRTAFVIL